MTHSNNFFKVRFTSDESYLIAIGGFNRSIIQYKLKRLGADENGVGVLVMPDADLPSQPNALELETDVADDLDQEEN